MASFALVQTPACAHHGHSRNTKPSGCPSLISGRRAPVGATVNAWSSCQAMRNVKVHAVAVEVVEEDQDTVTSAKLRIKLKAYNVPIIREAEQQILDAAAATGATVSGPIPLPTRIKRWCVLRSPHVNKDSREHFEMRIHQRLLDINDLSAQTIDKFMNLDMPAGVDVNVKLL